MTKSISCVQSSASLRAESGSAMSPMSRSLGVAFFLVAASFAFVPTTAHAAATLLHEGANNPTTEGWTAFASANALTSAGPVLNDLGTGLDAWSVDDTSSAFDTLRYYNQLIAPAEVAIGASAGWRLSVNLRIVDAPDELVTVAGFGLAGTISALYRDATRDWYLGFGSEADGDPIVRLPGGSTFTMAGGGSGYHLYELVFDPSAGSADFFIDGVERVSNVVGSITSATHNSVLWGAATSPDDGTGNFNYVRFANSPAPIPEPSVALLVGAGLALLAARRGVRA